MARKATHPPIVAKSGAISKGYNFASTWEQNAPLSEQQQSCLIDVSEVRLKVCLETAPAERPHGVLEGMVTMKKLTQGMVEYNKKISSAKSDEAKDSIKTDKQNTTTGLRTCNNILAMTKPLHAKVPAFIGDKSINLSWKEATKTVLPSTTSIGNKRPASGVNGPSGNFTSKKSRGGEGMQNQLVNRAFEGISYGPSSNYE